MDAAATPNAQTRALLARLEPIEGSIDFFRRLKAESERYWKSVSLERSLYGFQVQPSTEWRPGLSEQQLAEFEEALGFAFPEILRNYFRVMNGTTFPQVNIYGSSGESHTYAQKYYAWPENIHIIRKSIAWICQEMKVQPNELKRKNISRIFPVVGHRFLMIDIPGHPVLSMYGNDIIPWSHDLCGLLIDDIFGEEASLAPGSDEAGAPRFPEVPFWLGA